MGTEITARATAHASRPKPLTLKLLSDFELRTPGRVWSVAEAPRRLLVYLALADRPQNRTLVAASLWPDRSDTRAAANLRSVLWRLPTPHGLNLVVSNGSTLHLSDDLAVDCKVVEALGWDLIEHPARGVDRVDPDQFLDQLLPGWYDDWVIFERERILQLHLRFLEALAYALIDAGRLARALDAALRLVNVDPLRESSQRALLAVYNADGSLGQARRQYENYRQLIREIFNCEPSTHLASLVAGISQEPGHE